VNLAYSLMKRRTSTTDCAQSDDREVACAARSFLLLPLLTVAATLAMTHTLRSSERSPRNHAQFQALRLAASSSLLLADLPQPRADRLTASTSDTLCVSAVCSSRDGPWPAALASERPDPRQDMISTPEATDFGLRLAAAARSQTGELIIYTARYRSLAYPMGDVAPLHGACTDVVVRAYRALGIDLQELVHRAHVGSGDANIDHRRTETLRRFFARYGEALPVTAFPEDYRPGDIVTYYRPFSRVSRSHIAIVSDVLAPTTRPMIVHNRGWGPQIEDALFVDRITGHYRFAARTNDAFAGAAARTPANLRKASFAFQGR